MNRIRFHRSASRHGALERGHATGHLLPLGWTILFSVLHMGCTPNASDTKQGSLESSTSSGGSSTPLGLDGKQPDGSENQSQGIKSNPASNASIEDARALVEECLGRYRNMKRYSDQGQLTVAVEGAPNFTTPFRVAWERPNHLAIVAHHVLGSWTSTTWEAICSEPSNPFPKQRLIRPLPNAIDLKWLMSDNLGGLFSPPVGLPIQLELLLSQDSSQVFSGTDTKLTPLESATTDGHSCHRIRVEKEGLTWVLWIDPEKKLLRKMELPAQLFYPALSEKEQSQVRCEVDVRDAKEDEAIDWSQWKVPVRPDDVGVRRLVPPPPIASTRILGTVLDPFDLKDINKELIFDAAEPKRAIQVLCWIGEDPASEAFVKDLLAIRKILTDQELNGKCQIILVGREADKGLPEALKRWNCDLPLAIDRAQLSESLFHIPGVPSLVILDRNRRVQVSEMMITSAIAASIPSLVLRLSKDEDLASRQLQQDADNQARYVAALHRVAVDKTESSKLGPLRPFQFSMHGMRRDWRIPFDEPLVSAGGAWYPDVATGALSEKDPIPFTKGNNAIVMAALDEKGKLFVITEAGTSNACATVDTDQADGAKRIHTSIDPWSHAWISIVPEGLPRFWITPVGLSESMSNATTYNTVASETPIGFAWTGLPQDSKLAILTSASRLLAIDPKTEQRMDAAIGQDSIALVPGLDFSGAVTQWDALSDRGRLSRIQNLTFPSPKIGSEPTLEARLEQLTIPPEPGQWLWGRHGSIPTTLSLGKLSSGETGIVVSDSLHQALNNRPLTVRPEQARILGSTRMADGSLYGVAFGPNRVLHLFSADLRIMDQVSFDARIMAAALFPSNGDLKLVIALENEVSCWTIDVPDLAPTSELTSGTPAKQDAQ